jgi:rare lipoprotein A
VRINDRGPYVANRLIDLSWQTAHTLGYSEHGLARVRVRYAGRAQLNGDDGAERRYLAAQTWAGGDGRVAQTAPAPISTGSVRTTSVRTISVTPATWAQAQPQQPPPESWSVVQYRQGQGASGARDTRAALGAPVADTYLRVGPFASRNEAERLRYMLAGGDSSDIEVADGSEPAYRVRLGPYNDSDAASAMARIAAAGFDPDASVQSPPATGRRR